VAFTNSTPQRDPYSRLIRPVVADSCRSTLERKMERGSRAIIATSSPRLRVLRSTIAKALLSRKMCGVYRPRLCQTPPPVARILKPACRLAPQ
jgi:hypothetical protein